MTHGGTGADAATRRAIAVTLLVEPSSQPRGEAAPIRLGVPMPRGAVSADAAFTLAGEDGRQAPVQARVLDRWSDGSTRWLLVDALVAPSASQVTRWTLRTADDPPTGGNAAAARPVPAAMADADRHDVSGRDVAWRFGGAGREAIASCRRTGVDADGSTRGDPDRTALDPMPLEIAVSAQFLGEAHPEALELTSAAVRSGPVCVEIQQTGRLGGGRVECVLRWTLYPSIDAATCELQVRNPKPARHVGGLWDLGDAHAERLADLTWQVRGAAPAHPARCRPDPDAPVLPIDPQQPWTLLQDSSGGERWDSPNHVDAAGRQTVRFRGWRAGADVRAGPWQAEGLRAQPVVGAGSGAATIAVAAVDFWQNFPRALRRDAQGARLEIAFFPREAAPAELQPGEQKRHVACVAFGPEAEAVAASLAAPVHAWVDPSWVEASGAVSGLVVDLSDNRGWTHHVCTVVDGPDAFVERRERIDEYGWRNFGDLYADHEAIHADPAVPFVAHYNNQYDFVHSAWVHALRTGDRRWRRLAHDAARHVADIDIYHASGDRAAFNGGLFWHSDHYMTAGTATHRTYSRTNAATATGSYGGGPSNEHNYGSGLLLHHFLTGDDAAREAVIGLADWVLAMDDGTRTLFALVDPGPTGLASQTVDVGYHGPGRGGANSVNALLDGWVLTRRVHYLDAAESLIRRCVHPADDIAAHGLHDIENRWSYLVFLQVLGKYLALKQEIGEIDRMFHYARLVLVHYGHWIADREVPYKDVLDRVEIPTESWPAHDVRKCHVLHLAARHADGEVAERFRAKATFFFERCLSDLETFPTRHLTRPLVILAAYAHLHTAFLREPPGAAVPAGGWDCPHDFGRPAPFLRQRDRVAATLRTRLHTLRDEVRRLAVDRLARLRARRA